MLSLWIHVGKMVVLLQFQEINRVIEEVELERSLLRSWLIFTSFDELTSVKISKLLNIIIIERHVFSNKKTVKSHEYESLTYFLIIRRTKTLN